jgi:hypothetical protein
MYLSDIQKGIQTAHLVNEFWKKYNIPSEYGSEATKKNQEYLDSWAYIDQSIIVFDGGNQNQLEWIEYFFNQNNNQYPWAYFREDQISLNKALTAVGIILPKKFNTKEDRQEYVDGRIGTIFETQLAELLESSHLA